MELIMRNWAGGFSRNGVFPDRIVAAVAGHHTVGKVSEQVRAPWRRCWRLGMSSPTELARELKCPVTSLKPDPAALRSLNLEAANLRYYEADAAELFPPGTGAPLRGTESRRHHLLLDNGKIPSQGPWANAARANPKSSINMAGGTRTAWSGGLQVMDTFWQGLEVWAARSKKEPGRDGAGHRGAGSWHRREHVDVQPGQCRPFLRPLPYREPGQLVQMKRAPGNAGDGPTVFLAMAKCSAGPRIFRMARKNTRSFLPCGPRFLPATGVNLNGRRASGNGFQAGRVNRWIFWVCLGSSHFLGRLFFPPMKIYRMPKQWRC